MNAVPYELPSRKARRLWFFISGIALALFTLMAALEVIDASAQPVHEFFVDLLSYLVHHRLHLSVGRRQ